MITLRTLTSIICFILILHQFPKEQLPKEQESRKRLLSIATAELGVRELSGNNDGKRVETYLAAVKLKQGQPWCAAFVSWVFKEAGYPQPRTGWSPALFNKTLMTKDAFPGNVLGIWFPQLKRIAHVDMVEGQQGDWVLSIEGNTNVQGSREGDGVYRKRRHAKTIVSFSDWINKERG